MERTLCKCSCVKSRWDINTNKYSLKYSQLQSKKKETDLGVFTLIQYVGTDVDSWMRELFLETWLSHFFWTTLDETILQSPHRRFLLIPSGRIILTEGHDLQCLSLLHSPLLDLHSDYVNCWLLLPCKDSFPSGFCAGHILQGLYVMPHCCCLEKL